MSRCVAVVVFPGFQLLDAAGPIAAFELAARFHPGSYRASVVSPGGGAVPSSSGAALASTALAAEPVDTVVVAGGDVGQDRPAATAIIDWLRHVPRRRVASVCSGAYLLAEAGLLDGRTATTHWASGDDFARRYPRVRLAADRIFVEDGDVWTSAGITAGIDLTLALIEADEGAGLARRVAQQLVVHHRRTGGQSQFSSFIDVGGRSGRFAGLIDWMRDNLTAPLAVEHLAGHAAMSPRHFARAFVAETGMTPAKAVERLRLEAARRAVESGPAPLESIAADTGFGELARMRRAFVRTLGQSPQSLRRSARRRSDQ